MFNIYRFYLDRSGHPNYPDGIKTVEVVSNGYIECLGRDIALEQLEDLETWNYWPRIPFRFECTPEELEKRDRKLKEWRSGSDLYPS